MRGNRFLAMVPGPGPARITWKKYKYFALDTMNEPTKANHLEHAPKIAMTLLVRDNDDILEENVLYHASQGVDLFIIMDNLSTDTTRHIIKKLATELPIIYHNQTNDDYRQAEWVTLMAQEAASEPHDVDWIINNDADEFWVFPMGSIREYLRSIPPHISALHVKRFNALNCGGDGKTPSLSTSHPRESIYFDVDSRNCLGDPLPPKCLHRASREVNISMGNHSVSGLAGDTIAVENPFILHYPYREFSRYLKKITLGGAALERNPDISPGTAITWRKHYALANTNELNKFWCSLYVSSSRLQRGLISGKYMQCSHVSSTLRLLNDERQSLKTRDSILSLIDKTMTFARQKRKTILGHFKAQPTENFKDTLYWHNLPFAVEGFSRQVKSVRGLLSLSKTELVPQLENQLPDIRDAFSLSPDNPYFFTFLETLLEIFSPASFAKLREYCLGKRIILHVSCRKLIHRSLKSSQTFQDLASVYPRLIVVGDPSIKSPEVTQIGFELNDIILYLPVSDAYEHLASKLFLALLIINLVTKPQLVIKLDDELQLHDRQVFQSFVEESVNEGYPYVGYEVGASHQHQWHGWHINKCLNKSLDRKGFQYPLVRSYAAGGFGYLLNHEALNDCLYMFMAMRGFFEQQAVQLEDVYVGHAIQMHGRKVKSIQLDQPLLLHAAALPGLHRVFE
jgi:hypothetical protein